MKKIFKWFDIFIDCNVGYVKRLILYYFTNSDFVREMALVHNEPPVSESSLQQLPIIEDNQQCDMSSFTQKLEMLKEFLFMVRESNFDNYPVETENTNSESTFIEI